MATHHLRGATNTTMEKLKLWSDVISTWVTIIGAFAGGTFALVQYLDQASSARVQETLRYVERFNKEPLQKVTMHLEEFWNARAEKVLKPVGGEQALATYINSEIGNNKLENDTSLLFSFFDSLQACTCAKLCDEDTMHQFFGKHAYNFHLLYYPYIAEQRKNLRDASFGVGVEALARSYKKPKLSKYCADK